MHNPATPRIIMHTGLWSALAFVLNRQLGLYGEHADVFRDGSFAAIAVANLAAGISGRLPNTGAGAVRKVWGHAGQTNEVNRSMKGG